MKTSGEHEYHISMTIVTSKSKHDIEEDIRYNFNVECYKCYELDDVFAFYRKINEDMGKLNRKELHLKLQGIFVTLDDDEMDLKLKGAITKWLDAEQRRQALKY